MAESELYRKGEAIRKSLMGEEAFKRRQAEYNANPVMQDLSIRIEGYLNGDPDNTFVFTSELDEEQQHQFDPVTYVAGSAYHLVFRFDHRNWFSDGEGGYIDPNEAQIASSRSIVEENIKDGFDVYQP